MCCLKLSPVGGRASYLRFRCWQNMTYLSASMVHVCLRVLWYRSRIKASVLSASFSSMFCWVIWWAAPPCRIVHGFFVPWRDKLLVESPGRAWNAGRDCHNLSPCFFCIECTRIHLWWSVTPVRNQSSLHPMPVKWDTHRTSTSASGDWITIADVGESLTPRVWTWERWCPRSVLREWSLPLALHQWNSPRLWGASLELAFLVQSCKVMKTKSHTSWSYFVGFGCTWPTAWAPVY